MYKTLTGKSSGTFETRSLLGKDYLVVPVIAMIEGVRHGAAQTSGELGLAAEFGKFPDGWNSKPVTLSHPQLDGAFVSAGSPEVLGNASLGIVFNTRLDGKKLRMEAWLDLGVEERDEETTDLFTRVQNGDIIEVSVGFFTDVEERKGTFKGQSYTGVWRNIVPDHLAILRSTEIGACSVADGCGTRVNKGKEKIMAKPKTQCGCHEKGVVQIITQSDTLDDKTAGALNHIITQAVPSELLSGDVHNSLRAALNQAHSWAYVVGYTNDFVIFETWRNSDDRWVTLRQGFNMDADGEVAFTSDPEEVRIISRIVPVSGDDGNVNVNNQTQETDMPKTLTTQTTENPVVENPKVETPETEPKVETPKVETPATTPAPAAPAVETPAVQAKVPTVQEYIANAPEGIRDVLDHSYKVHEAAKASIIKGLKDSGRCKLSDDFLKAQSLESLQALSELAQVPSYAGRVEPAPRAQTQDSGVAPAPKVFASKTAAA